MRTWGRSACSIKWKGNKTWHRQLFLFSSSHQPAALLLLSFFFFFTPKTLLFDTFPILVSPFRFLLPCCSGIGTDETRPRDTSGRRCQHIDRLFFLLFLFFYFLFFYRRFIPISGVSMSRTRLPCLYLNFGGWYWRSARRRVHIIEAPLKDVYVSEFFYLILGVHSFALTHAEPFDSSGWLQKKNAWLYISFDLSLSLLPIFIHVAECVSGDMQKVVSVWIGSGWQPKNEIEIIQYRQITDYMYMTQTNFNGRQIACWPCTRVHGKRI